MVPIQQIEYGVKGDLIMIYPKPYSIYSRGTTGCRVRAYKEDLKVCKNGYIEYWELGV